MAQGGYQEFLMCTAVSYRYSDGSNASSRPAGLLASALQKKRIKSNNALELSRDSGLVFGTGRAQGSELPSRGKIRQGMDIPP